MKKIDCSGLDCPEPVVKAKKALEENNKITIIVDNEVAANNVSRMAIKQGYQVDETRISDQEYELLIYGKSNQEAKTTTNNISAINKNTEVMLITTDRLGEGPEELGELLMNGLLKTIADLKNRPDTLILMNNGVKLATTNLETAKILEKLLAEGLELKVCGTCLEFLELKDDLKVGQISNMYEILELITSNSTVHL
ncbi:sulfurtransferase-like selenium metabolism protein YedF [Halanaerobiaceae bacterium Z-7014]|uniref:Sulfurtransferase-like selenium metabolism protein YedF n=1 Tax=Halonatronomonas betaini TaxID=2778430 RepID=A0A931ASY1_9FIRM|nr:sulfurtransferase-like selenium metabolism protein YedF [Halonatronomonas betaini]MBF8435616.1 sulfurtransferase-like selenium metabolism protein YedF [Halonatronomonas betaini]